MRGWSKQLLQWAGRQRSAVEDQAGPVRVPPPAVPSTNAVPERTVLEVEEWLEQKASELNGDWSLARLSGFSRGEDAAARQVAAALLRPTEELSIEPAPEDLYSTAAMRVCTLEGITIGYLESRVAETVSRQLKEGDLIRCFVYKVTLNERQLPSNVVLAVMSWALSPVPSN